MDAIRGGNAAIRRQGRRWHFASAVLDEGSWTLLVDGRRVPIEAKPLELLHELLLRAGEVVTKDQLLDAVWPGLSVVEASLPTAVLKLRRALGEEKGEGRIIETMPRIGYRLAVPIELESPCPPLDPHLPFAREPRYADEPKAGGHHAREKARPHRRLMIAAGLILAIVAGTIATARLTRAPSPDRPPTVSRTEAIEALRALDIPRLRGMLARGWNPAAALDRDRNGAINIALEICEWNPQHDRRQLMLVVRMLMDNGAWIEDHNAFGDTPYSIASAPRYCGPDHPVTRMLHAMCYSGPRPPRDRCLATYAQARH